jgi:hypothetical protein
MLEPVEQAPGLYHVGVLFIFRVVFCKLQQITITTVVRTICNNGSFHKNIINFFHTCVAACFSELSKGDRIFKQKKLTTHSQICNNSS